MAKIAKRYAQALIDAAGLANAQKDLALLKSLCQLIESNSALKVALLNPAVSIEDKKGVLDEITKQLQSGQKEDADSTTVASTTIESFLKLLLAKSRLSIIEQITADLDALIKDYKKALSITFTSAAPITVERQQVLKAKLIERCKTERGKTASNSAAPLGWEDFVTIDWKTNPELIGGASIAIGDAIIDNSVKAKLDAMREALIS